MRILRTPDAAFAGITDFPFAPHYAEIADGQDKLRIHYVDEGPRDAGFRVVAPDLVGFGRSDKPSEATDYSYARHVAWMRSWLETLDLRNITLVCQDWGSLIGLRLLAEMPDRFSGVVLSNGGLPAGQPAPRAFAIWRAFSQWSPVFPIGRLVNAGSQRKLSKAEIAAYDAPFLDSRYKAGARIFPSFVPLGDNVAVPDQIKAWQVLDAWDKPFLCCFSDGDPITRGGYALFIGRVPGTKGQKHVTLNGGHFIQENDPQGFVDCVLKVARL